MSNGYRPTDIINPPLLSLRQLSRHLAGLVQNRLWLQVLVGMVLGLIVGVLLGPSAGLIDTQIGANIGNWSAFTRL